MTDGVLFFDIESDNLTPMITNIWCVGTRFNGEANMFYDAESFLDYLHATKPSVVVGHNISTFDCEALRRVWGIPYKYAKQDKWAGLNVCFRDTLLLSQMMNADRPGGHSLKEFGKALGLDKIEFEDFSKLSDNMVEYCHRDVELTEQVYKLLMREVEAYGVEDFFSQPFWTACKLAYNRMGIQADMGIGFDRERAEELFKEISERMEAIEAEIEPQLPLRELNKGELDFWRFPTKPFLKNGDWSASMRNWLEKTGATVEDEQTIKLDGEKYTVAGSQPTKTHGPMELSDQSKYLKDWLLSLGWEPTMWNVAKDEKGKKKRDERGNLVLTSPKLSDKGEVCPNLYEIGGEYAELAKKVATYFSLRNRRGNLRGQEGKGWLNNPRLDYDGRLSAGSSGITPSFRAKHTIVTNIPKNKPSVLLGKEFRQLYRAAQGKVLVGWDASGLEDRLKGHFTYKFDGGAYATKILDPEYDVHQEAADAWGMERQDAKSGVYALAYKCGVATLAKTLKCSITQAKERHEAYWEINSSMVKLEERLVQHWETWGEQKWIKGLDGRKIRTRSKHSLVNNLIQGAGSVILDYSLLWLDKKLGGVYYDEEGPHYRWKGHKVKRCAFIHDELVVETDEEVAQDIAELGRESIKWAGRYFKLNVELESEGKIGQTWADLK